MLSQSKDGDSLDTGLHVVPPDRALETWRDFMREGNVSASLIESQVKIITAKQLELIGLTEAQRTLPQREYLGRGIESMMILPGHSILNEVLATKTVSLVSKTFHSDESVPSDEQPTATWERSFRKRMAGESYFIEADPGFEGHVGVVDAMFVYVARKNPEQELTMAELLEARLIGIHGLYHYLPNPEVYFGVRLAVDPELQNQGVGRKMMSHNIRQCLRLGAKERQIFTEADPLKNKKVLDLYRGWGFTPTGRSIMYNGTQQIFLSAKLEPGTKAMTMAEHFADEDGPMIRI